MKGGPTASAAVPANMAALAAANPAIGFYASPAARLLGALLRTAHRWSPRAATQLALQLFFTPLPSKQHARAKPVPAPWQPQRRRFEQGDLVTWQRGDVVAGAPRVLLVHGWAGDAQQWRQLGDQLAAAGFDPVLLDLPAHGRSDGRRTTLPQWVRALFAVTATLGPWHAVVGHSLGALASAHALARGLPAGRLVLVAASPPPRLFLRWFASGLGPGETLAARMQGRIEQREGVPMLQFEPAWLGQHLRQPTLLLHDREDRIAPLASAQALAAALQPGGVAGGLAGGLTGGIVISSGLGHRRILSDAPTLERVTQFLREAG
ncbi:alpha/beta fold hydrolase [Aquabacterium sp.]|uniref:alpha/beta fold hydrolase n=1 Tax=Aquabacterium sp. TaxID=1872578 RepID=UPI002C43D920|nr:alpha/beta fold hydrolase [Aquabacterium sp.]HSW05357.1 alpha/beta fold hydrolase [Aquabacterium sp.]